MRIARIEADTYVNRRRSLTPVHLQPHPRPLSEWRGAWKLPLACKLMLNGNRGNNILELTKRPSPIKEKPHPQPLSEWRGAWLQLLACKVMLNRNRGNNILELKKRPSRFEKGVSLCRKEPLFTSKRRPLYLQSAVFTPLSIRRGVGGEAVDRREWGLFFPYE